MEHTKIDITLVRDDDRITVDEQTIANAIVAESFEKLYSVYQIKLSGKHTRQYNVLTGWASLSNKDVLVDDNLLIIALTYDLAVIDLQQDKLVRIIELSDYQLFSIVKFKSGYIVHAELDTYFLDKNFAIVWQEGCVDIFFNSNVENDFEVFEDFVIAYDWYGYKHYYDESGEFKHEYYPELSMSD